METLSINIMAAVDLVPSKFGFVGETYLFEITKALQDRGHEIKLICNKMPNQPLKENVNGINLERILRRYYAINELIATASILRTRLDLLTKLENVDICHVENTGVALLGRNFKNRSTWIFDLRAMWTQQNEEFNIYQNYYRTKKERRWYENLILVSGKKVTSNTEKHYERKACNVADRIVTLTPTLKSLVVERYRPIPEKIDVISSAVNFEKFDPNKIDGSKIRKEYGLKEGKTIVYSGSITPFRGIEELIMAFKQVVSKKKDIKMLIIGGCNEIYAEHLRKLIKKLGIEKNVIITGYKPYNQVPEFLKCADIAISPMPPIIAYVVSFPMKLLEYMSMEIPIIASAEIPTHASVIGSNECGLTYEQGT